MNKEKEKNIKIVLGIDLGTSNSQACYQRKGIDSTPVSVRSPDSVSSGSSKASSTHIYKDPKKGTWIYGEAAKRSALTWGFENCAREFKKIIGVCDSTGKEKKLKFADQELTGVELSSKFLRYLKEISEKQAGQEINDCVITVPAAFDNARREATKNAAQIAGFNVLRLVNEPTAAALAYKLEDKDNKQSKTVGVFDIGGGTFDFTLLSMEEGALQVTASDGDLKLGGTYMDQALMEYILRDIERVKNIKIKKGDEKYQTILKEIEKVKMELTTIEESRLLIDLKKDNVSSVYDKRLERATFQRLISPLISRIDDPINRCLKEANIKKEEIDHIIMVGGPSRIPAIIKKAEQIFGTGKICKDIDPMECVAIGAAIQGSIITGGITDLLLIDVAALSIGIRTKNDIMEKMILKGTSLPCSATKGFCNADELPDQKNDLPITIFQGERLLCKDNIELGNLIVKDLPKAKASELTFDITLEADRNSILLVSASCIHPQTKQKIENKATLANVTTISEEEKQKRIKDFELNQEKDNKIKEVHEITTKISTSLEEIETFKETKTEIFEEYSEIEKLNKEIAEANQFLLKSFIDLSSEKEQLEILKGSLNNHLNQLYAIQMKKEEKEKPPANSSEEEKLPPESPPTQEQQDFPPSPESSREEELDEIL